MNVIDAQSVNKNHPQMPSPASFIGKVDIMSNLVNWPTASNAPQPDVIVDANQLTSINAMISYVAHKLGSTEFRVERILSDRFNIPNAKCLPASSFDQALRYLTDRL